MDLEAIKRYDDSWWLKYLKHNTIFDSDNIKAQKDWLIEQAEQLEKIKKFSNDENITLVDFAKEVLRIIEERETSNRKQRS